MNSPVPDHAPGIDCAIDAAARALAGDTGVDYRSLSGRGQARWRERAEVTVRAWHEYQRQTAEKMVPEPCRSCGKRAASIRACMACGAPLDAPEPAATRRPVWSEWWRREAESIRAERDEARAELESLAAWATEQSEGAAACVAEHDADTTPDLLKRLADQFAELLYRKFAEEARKRSAALAAPAPVPDTAAAPPEHDQILRTAIEAMDRFSGVLKRLKADEAAPVPDPPGEPPLTEAKLKYFVRLAMTVAVSAEDPESWPYGRMRRMIDTIADILGWELGVVEPPVSDPVRSRALVKRCESPSPGNWPCPSCGAAVDEACQQVAPASVRRPDDPTEPAESLAVQPVPPTEVGAGVVPAPAEPEHDRMCCNCIAQIQRGVDHEPCCWSLTACWGDCPACAAEATIPAPAAPSEATPAPTSLHVPGRCPACGQDHLMVGGHGRGHLTCTWDGCPRPWAADELLCGPAKVDDPAEVRARIARLRAEATPTEREQP